MMIGDWGQRNHPYLLSLRSSWVGRFNFWVGKTVPTPYSAEPEPVFQVYINTSLLKGKANIALLFVSDAHHLIKYMRGTIALM